MATRPMKQISGLPGLEGNTYTFVQLDNTLTTAGKAADAKKTGDGLNDLKSAFADTADKMPKVTLAKISKAQHCVRISDGAFAPISNTYCATQFDVEGNNFVYVTAHLSSPSDSYASYLFVDANENVLEYKNTSGNGTYTDLVMAVPADAKYLRLGTLTSDYTDAVVKAMADIADYVADAVEPIANEIQKVKVGYTQLQISDLVQGSYNSSGAVTTNTRRIRCNGFLDVKAGETLYFEPGTVVTYIYYGVWRNGVFVGEYGWSTSLNKTFDADAQIIVTYKNDTNTDLSPSEYDAITRIVLPVSGSVTGYVDPINQKVDKLYAIGNYFDKTDIETPNATMNGDGSIAVNEDYDVFYVDLGEAKTAVFMTGALENMTFRYYNASGNAISSAQFYVDKGPREMTLPSGTRFIRFGCKKTYQPYFMITDAAQYEYIPHYLLNTVVLNSPQNWWAGKIGDSLGDSLTEQRFFQLYTKKYFGLSKFYIHGIGGTKMTGAANQYGDSMWMDSRINALSVDADFVTVLGGQNDGNVEIGEISKSNINTDTYAGALNTVINKIYAHCKSGIIIILCTPFYVPSEGAGGERFARLDEAVRGVAKLHGLPVADFGGLSTADENTADLYWGTDRTHPIEDFHKNKLAPILISTMENIRPIDWDKINNYGKFINSIQYLP